MASGNSTLPGHKRIDLAGQKFGRWTVLGFHSVKNGDSLWTCRCECGIEKPVRRWSLVTGRSRQCGSCVRVHPASFIDLTGQIFGKWTVIKIHSTTNFGQARWLCRCECGTQQAVMSHRLRQGKSYECDSCVQMRHVAYTPEYRAWGAMKTRCYNKKTKYYHRYGGRGITVCDRWLESFENFFEDMGKRPSLEYSLDRINNSLGYSPDNCRWATRSEQQRNMRSNRILTHNGKSMCAAAWSRITGISKTLLNARLKAGWSIDRVLTTPVRAKKPHVRRSSK